MNHKIFFLGDIEMGGGDIMDDFSDDEHLIEFIKQLTPEDKTTKTTLVLLGDIFDFLKMSYMGKYPRYITEEISLWKLSKIIKVHTKVFDALKDFIQNKNTHIEFIIGNHDADLAWPKVQNKIKDYLKNQNRINFGFEFKNRLIHAEHGHQSDPFFKTNIKKPIIKHNKKEILNLPFGTHACFSHLVHIKQQFPEEERLYPNPLALKQNKKYRRESKKKMADLFIKNILLKPLIHPLNPTFKVPYIPLIKHSFKYGFNLVDDEKFIKDRAHRVIKKNPNKQVYILAHAHVLKKKLIKNKQVFIIDTWRDEYDLRNNKEKKPKSYVEVFSQNDELIYAKMKLIYQKSVISRLTDQISISKKSAISRFTDRISINQKSPISQHINKKPVSAQTSDKNFFQASHQNSAQVSNQNSF